MAEEITKNKQEKTKQMIIDQLKLTPIIELTCKKVGIGRATFYRWRKNSEKFAEQVEEALDEGLSKVSDLAESKLISAIQDDNLTAIIFWLKNRHKSYSNKLEISGNVKTDAKLTPEQEQAILKALELSNLNNNPLLERPNEENQ